MNVRPQRVKAVRWAICLVLLFSALSCFAPQIYASTDCDRWVAEYKQGLLQKRMMQRVAAAKYRLHHKLVAFRPHPPVNPLLHRVAHRRHMGPLTRLRHFMIDCGVLPPDKTPELEIATVPTLGLLPPGPVTPLDETALVFSPTPPLVPASSTPPTDLGFPPTVASGFPPFGPGGSFPTSGPTGPGTPPSGILPPGSTPPGTLPPSNLPPGPPAGPGAPSPSPVPEPSSLLLVLTGAGVAAVAVRRRTRPATSSADLA